MTRSRIYEIEDRPIPAALSSLVEFKSLNDEQRLDFIARLKYIEETTKKIDEWVSGAETDLRAFLDRVELDLYLNQGAPRPDDSPISSWLVHTSWTFDTAGQKMYRTLPTVVAHELDRPQPGLGAEVGAWNVWLAKQNAALRMAVSGFYDATDISGVIAHLIAVDVLLVNILAGVSKLRLHPGLNL
jgi:hypothetical protein